MVDTPVASLVVQITHIVVKSIRPSLRSESKKWHLKLRVKRDVTRNQTLRTTSWYKCNLYDNIASYYVDFIIDYPPLRIFSHYTIFYSVIIGRYLPSSVFSIVRLAHWPRHVFMREKIFFFQENVMTNDKKLFPRSSQNDERTIGNRQFRNRHSIETSLARGIYLSTYYYTILREQSKRFKYFLSHDAPSDETNAQTVTRVSKTHERCKFMRKTAVLAISIYFSAFCEPCRVRCTSSNRPRGGEGNF